MEEQTLLEQLMAELDEYPDGDELPVSRELLEDIVAQLASAEQGKSRRSEALSLLSAALNGVLAHGVFTEAHVKKSSKKYASQALEALDEMMGTPSPCETCAAKDALDAIAKECGCEKWEYPGQVVRDVQLLKGKLVAPAPTANELPAWGWSTMDGERYTGAPTREQAIADAREELGAGATFLVGPAVHPMPERFFPGASEIVDGAGEASYDEVDEAAEGWPKPVAKEALAELDAAITAWARRYCPVDFWMVEKPEVITPEAKP